jgi:CdiI N-terminal domain
VFLLEFLPNAEARITTGLRYRDARIIMGDFEECFPVVLELWSEGDYERQWREGARRIISGAEKSCLVTTIASVETQEATEYWALYLRGNAVVVQQFLSPPGEVDPSDVYADVLDYDDAHGPSEWRISCKELAAYAEAPD